MAPSGWAESAGLSHEAQGDHQAGQRVRKAGGAGAVDHRLVVYVILHVAGVVINAVGKEQVVQIFAPVGEQAALAQKGILLPGMLLIALAYGAAGTVQRGTVAHHGQNALYEAEYEQQHYEHIHQHAGDAVHASQKAADIFHHILPSDI